MDKLGSYKLDKAYSDGVEIRLDNAPEVIFMVRLPSMYNRAYTQALYAGMEMDVGEDGKVTGTTNIMDAKYAQEDAFCDHCLASIDGEPISPSFQNDYPSAVAELMEKATELAGHIEEGVADSVKKSPTTSHGKGDGAARKSSTASLNSVAG
jgi:hypothetical protein